jgi:DNA-binding HxlR family transcriptional regulator
MVKKRKNPTELPPEQCPLGTCMSYFGGAWVANIIWYLSSGPRRFSELKDDLQTIAPKVLSDKLKKMERDGLIVRVIQPTSPPTVEYSLSELGQEFKPILKAIINVGHKLKNAKKLF